MTQELKFKKVSKKTFMERFPSEAEMKAQISGCQGSIKNSREGMQYRSDNYYNCVDDYSMGGICDQAAMDNIRQNEGAIKAMEEQIEKGTRRETVRRQVLCDLDGNILTDQIVNTKFGGAWIIRNGEEKPKWVNITKRQATYEKKGFRVMTVSMRIESYRLPVMAKNGLIVISRITKKELVPATLEEVDWSVTQKDKVEYFALNAES